MLSTHAAQTRVSNSHKKEPGLLGEISAPESGTRREQHGPGTSCHPRKQVPQPARLREMGREGGSEGYSEQLGEAPTGQGQAV